VLGMLNECEDDSECKGVLLRMDTPGGMMVGGPEIADAVAKLRMSKPVVAHAGGVCASLGYMIASQANEVIANRSAIVGSIGVIASVANYTDLLSKMGIRFDVFTNKEAKFKAAGAIGTNLSAEQRDNIQQSVDSAFTVFKSAVTSARPQVKPEAMQGQTYRGSEAQSVGLVDRVGGENYAMSVLKQLMVRHQ
jgi:protease IV